MRDRTGLCYLQEKTQINQVELHPLISIGQTAFVNGEGWLRDFRILEYSADLIVALDQETSLKENKTNSS